MTFINMDDRKNKSSVKKHGNRFMNNVRKAMSVILGISVLAQAGAVNAAVSAEQVVNAFTATPNGQAIVNNMKYTDITNAAYDLKDAVYQNGAIGLMPSPGSTKFSPDTVISKEMALYMVYTAANRALDINTQGQTLNNARAAAQKKTSLQAVLFDGSLQLAAKDGLISQQDLDDALQTAQATGTFKRSSAVTRQEFAAWLAKALMLAPVYNQQRLLNNYTDWKSVKADYAAYVEALLENNIMSGDGAGKFNPNKAVTRGQAARILKNAENVVLPLRSMERRTATIEKRQLVKDTSKGNQTDYITYYVRNSDGLLDTITIGARYQKPTTTSNEQNAKAQPEYRTELPVYKNGKMTNSQSLAAGDRIEYIAGVDDKVVYYAHVLSSSKEISYIAAIVNSIDSTAKTINITPLTQKIQYPNEEVANPKAATYPDGSTVYENHSYSNNLVNAVTKSTIDLNAIKPESFVIIGMNQNMIVELTPVTIKKEREQGLVAGIVQENNPQLGYITLYNADGTGKTPLELSKLRTYNYVDPNSVEAFKNHVPAKLEDIEEGDTVFVRTDASGAVKSVSSVPNYTIRYGKIVTKKLNSITVETEKGVQLQYSTDGADIIKDGRLAKLSQLNNGDKVKLLINEAPNATKLKELTIEGGDRLIANVYKGKFQQYDDKARLITLSDPWVLRKGQWVKDITDPFMTIETGEGFKAYYDGGERSVKKLNVQMTDKVVYIVSEKDYGNEENGVAATFINDADKEVSYNDKVYNTGANKFALQNALNSISYNNGTIVIKDGRLVNGGSVEANDYAYVMANRDADSGNLIAGVVSVEQRLGTQDLKLYRGRISGIDEYKSVTVGSYSKLNGINWDFANTPMTFALSADTRITDTDGITSQSDFNSGNGSTTFKNRTVYILSDGTKAIEISTAPFGNISVSGTVTTSSGAITVDADGQPTSVALSNCKYYNAGTHLWVGMGDSVFKLLNNTFVIKNNVRIKPSELKKGDRIRVLKKDSISTGDAYVIIVEE
jgi:hypothetical protein